jgi:hypothetical protein
MKSWDVSKFWGVIFLSEEWTKALIQFENGLNITWLGQSLVGYDIWINANPGSNQNEWKSEMFYRMIYGFYAYFKPLGTNIGQTIGQNTIRPENRDTYYGTKAWNFVVNNYDFVFLYNYVKHWDHWLSSGKSYFEHVDEVLMGGAKPFWILTQQFQDQSYYNDWVPEPIALEMKNAIDRNMVITLYRYSSSYNQDFYENWARALQCIELYASGWPYYESIVNGTNLLTGVVGNTYGWVDTGEEPPPPDPDPDPDPEPTPGFSNLFWWLTSGAGLLWLLGQG